MTSRRRGRASFVSIWAVGIVLGAWAGPVRAQDSSDCLMCHGDKELVGERLNLWFDEEAFAESVHASADCIDCHADLDGVEDFPHDSDLEPATCDMCHDDSFESIAAYLQSSHGKALEASDPDAPRCQDCHGGHHILKRTDPRSRAYPLRIPWTCTRCHADGEPIERHGELSREEVIARYKDTIHGPGLFERGLKVAPVCTNCHSAHGVLPYDNPASLIHKDHVNDSCRACHNDEAHVHEGVIHPDLWTQPGMVPICVDCHQPHQERRIAYGTNMSDIECLSCHGDLSVMQENGRESLFVDVEEFERSVHGRHLVACAQCHTKTAPARGEQVCNHSPTEVDCAICHDSQVMQFERGIHGSLHASGDENAPDCVECHGSHGIMESALPQSGDPPEWLREAVLASPTQRRNVPDLCARCHREGAPAALRHPEGDVQKVEHYRESIHGKGLIESGLVASANCVDCHSAHMELPPSDPESTVAPGNIVATCGKCHDGIDERFRHSIHSKTGNPDYVPSEGKPGLPHCNDCHSSHSVARTDLPGFKRSIVQQCGKCHEQITETYFGTYHGKVSELGNTVVARCNDCHGAHDILPPGNPNSTLSSGHIVGTCGKCHPGSHTRFASYLTHATHDDPERYPALYWSFKAMTWLLLGVFGFFGLHVLAWLPRSVKLRKELGRHHVPAADTKEKEYQRFNWLNRTLHRMVIVSFLGLALTGMALKFAEAGWAKVLIEIMGGTETAGWIHRICAVITFSYMGIHLVDLVRRFRKSGQSVRQFFLGPNTMIPTWKDVNELTGTMKWFFGLGPRPRYGKWTYWEKFDYFAVFWGVIVIGFSGLVLWFPVIATKFLPGWAINVATIIHSEEALLATGFIFTIHFFNTHLRPEKFPMDKVVFTGTMTIEELKADKPELYERLVTSGELEQFLVDPPNPRVKRRAGIFGAVALTIGVVLLILLVHGLITVGL